MLVLFEQTRLTIATAIFFLFLNAFSSCRASPTEPTKKLELHSGTIEDLQPMEPDLDSLQLIKKDYNIFNIISQNQVVNTVENPTNKEGIVTDVDEMGSEWDVRIQPYYTVPWKVTGEATVDGISVDLDIDLSELIDSL